MCRGSDSTTQGLTLRRADVADKSLSSGLFLNCARRCDAESARSLLLCGAQSNPPRSVSCPSTAREGHPGLMSSAPRSTPRLGLAKKVLFPGGDACLSQLQHSRWCFQALSTIYCADGSGSLVSAAQLHQGAEGASCFMPLAHNVKSPNSDAFG